MPKATQQAGLGPAPLGTLGHARGGSPARSQMSWPGQSWPYCRSVPVTRRWVPPWLHDAQRGLACLSLLGTSVTCLDVTFPTCNLGCAARSPVSLSANPSHGTKDELGQMWRHCPHAQQRAPLPAGTQPGKGLAAPAGSCLLLYSPGLSRSGTGCLSDESSTGDQGAGTGVSGPRSRADAVVA